MGKLKPSCAPLWADTESAVREKYPGLLQHEFDEKCKLEYETRYSKIFGEDAAAYEPDYDDEIDRFFQEKFAEQKRLGIY